MGIRRGAYESARIGNITPPARIAAHVPAINVGAGMSAMAGAMRDKAAAEREKWNLKPIFDGLMKVWGAYDTIKDAQYERMMDSATAMERYRQKVEAGTIGFDPKEWAMLKTSYDTRRATYDSAWISQVGAEAVNENEAADAFMNDVTPAVRESYYKRFRAEENAKKIAEAAVSRQETDYSNVEGMED